MPNINAGKYGKLMIGCRWPKKDQMGPDGYHPSWMASKSTIYIINASV